MKIIFKSLAVMTVAAATVVGCKDGADDKAQATAAPGLDLANMDTLVRPQDDFYNYVNGNWMKNTEIPEEESTWGGFSVLRKSTVDDVLEIVNNAQETNKYDINSDQGKAIALYKSELDTVARNEAGITPLQPALDAIAGISNTLELQTVTSANSAVSNPFAGFYVRADFTDSNMNAGYISPGRLGLPDRDYYTDQDAKSQEIRQKYVEHITNMLQYIGEDEASAKSEAEQILKIETQLAESMLTKVERRDARKMNNPMSVKELQALTPAIDWKKMFSDIGLKQEVDTVIVLQPEYMKELQNVIASSSIEDLKTLVKWATLNSAAGSLTTEMEHADWKFYNNYLNGTPKPKPADERALATVDRAMGEAIGQVYVDEKFPPEAKEKAVEMIDNIKDAFKDRINGLAWMTDSTKAKAIDKLNKFTVKIGYPDKWEDYSDVEIKEGNSYYENLQAVRKWGRADNLADYGQPVDKTTWGMSPQTVNAYFNPSYNEIVFPAAILQPPFYNYKADEAVNYGGIGAVIGHEISHAFDDSGARYDGDGNLKNWWTDADLESFTKRGDALAEQYSSIEVLDSVYINGKFTLGENIGDLGGLTAAYVGLQKYYEEHGHPEKIDGLTAEQRFFISWATIWRTKMREDALRTRIKTDPHSPGMYRAYVPLQNIDAFYDAFGIKEGDSMFIPEEQRVRIW